MVRRGDISDIDFQFLDLVANDLEYAPFQPPSLIFVVKTEKTERSHAGNVPDRSTAYQGSEMQNRHHHEQTYSTGQRIRVCVRRCRIVAFPNRKSYFFDNKLEFSVTKLAES